jgi:hypothetical protein
MVEATALSLFEPQALYLCLREVIEAHEQLACEVRTLSGVELHRLSLELIDRHVASPPAGSIAVTLMIRPERSWCESNVGRMSRARALSW